MPGSGEGRLALSEVEKNSPNLKGEALYKKLDEELNECDEGSVQDQAKAIEEGYSI